MAWRIARSTRDGVVPNFFRDLGIQHLGDGVDHIHVVHRDHDGLPQILIALDVSRDADLMDHGSHHGFQTG